MATHGGLGMSYAPRRAIGVSSVVYLTEHFTERFRYRGQGVQSVSALSAFDDAQIQIYSSLFYRVIGLETTL